ncbi:MAG: hydrogenase maturation nickel metallochaperone HypA [Propionibacteriaceae bacterium]|nr:hydrogenase maturation nickel metallochaperone HypA [Propionibacteriaceae bacterium]
MHELGLLADVVAAVRHAADTYGAVSVTKVGLRVGVRSGAVREALEGAWPIATQGTICVDATLEIEEIPARVWCGTCDKDQDIDQYFALTCPVCGSPAGKIVSGNEFDVTYADMVKG